MEKYAGMAVLEVDGTEIELTKLDVKHNTGRKSVKTMNSAARVRGYAQGIQEWALSVTAVIPIDGTVVDWNEITDSKITVYPVGHQDKRVTYQGCFVTEVGQSYTVDNEAVIDLQIVATNEVKE